MEQKNIKQQSLKRQGIFWTVVSAVLFGFNPVFSKTIYQMGGNPCMAAWVRLVVTAVGMMVVFKAVHPGDTMKISRQELKKLVICSQGYSITPLLMYASYHYISSGIATTIHFAYPVFVLIGSMFFLHQPMALAKRFSCSLCLLGILLLGRADGQASTAGFGLAFASSVTFAFYIIYLNGSGLQSMHPAKMASWLSMIGSCEVFVFILLTEKMVWNLSLSCIFLMCLFGVVSGCMASTFFQIGTKMIGPASASMLSTFEPLTSILIGAAVYNESVTWRAAAGIASILCAVIIIAKEELKQSK